MKQQESYSWAETPILDLQPLNFKPVPSDPRLIAYQALIKSPAPGIPMFSLTVTAASPGDDQQAERDLQSLLSNMRAGVLVADGGPVEDPPDDPEPFNPDTEIEIKAELVESGTTERTFGVIMVIQTAVDSGTEGGKRTLQHLPPLPARLQGPAGKGTQIYGESPNVCDRDRHRGVRITSATGRFRVRRGQHIHEQETPDSFRAWQSLYSVRHHRRLDG